MTSTPFSFKYLQAIFCVCGKVPEWLHMFACVRVNACVPTCGCVFALHNLVSWRCRTRYLSHPLARLAPNSLCRGRYMYSMICICPGTHLQCSLLHPLQMHIQITTFSMWTTYHLPLMGWPTSWPTCTHLQYSLTQMQNLPPVPTFLPLGNDCCLLYHFSYEIDENFVVSGKDAFSPCTRDSRNTYIKKEVRYNIPAHTLYHIWPGLIKDDETGQNRIAIHVRDNPSNTGRYLQQQSHLHRKT